MNIDIPESNIKKLFLRAIVVIAAIGGLFYWLFFSAPGDSKEPADFIVPLKTATSAAILKLKEEGFIRSTWAFRLIDTSKIEPGGYALAKSMNAREVARVIAQGPSMKWVVVPEGYRKEQIAMILARELGWTKQMENTWITIDTADDPDRIEGIYFPDTYLIPKSETTREVAARMRARFEEKFSAFAEEALKQNIRWPTLIKVASIVQREGYDETDMPVVAAVLWNRLLINMKLDIDATLQYARGNAGEGFWAPITPAEKKIDSPYNTYTHAGLPPTPISNPGLTAIKAVLNPAKTKCLFYLHDAEGEIHCAETYDEHLKNIKKYF